MVVWLFKTRYVGTYICTHVAQTYTKERVRSPRNASLSLTRKAPSCLCCSRSLRASSREVSLPWNHFALRWKSALLTWEQDTPNADHADTTKAYTVPCMRTVYMLYLHNITLVFFTNQKSHLRILKCKIL